MPALNRRKKSCIMCGTEMSVKASHYDRRKTCSKACDHNRRKSMYKGENNPNYGNRGEKNPLFKGERKLRCGYVVLYRPEHPMSDLTGYILEHRLVMSNHLGRLLLTSEDVHHIDENPLNNDISNLQVLTRSEHTALHNNKKEIVRDKVTGRILGVIKKEDE